MNSYCVYLRFVLTVVGLQIATVSRNGDDDSGTEATSSVVASAGTARDVTRDVDEYAEPLLGEKKYELDWNMPPDTARSAACAAPK